MGNKRYYWLKLKDDFFRQPKIKKLRQIAGGDTYTVIYLKLQLLSLQDDGRLIYEGIENTVAEEMALKIDEDPENVQVVLNYLKQQGLIEEADENEFSLTETQKLIGSETDKAELMRQSRARKRESMQEISNNVTEQLPPVTNCYREIEIRDRDKRIEIDNNNLHGAKNSSMREVVENGPKEKAVISLILNTKEEYPIYQHQISEWSELYPAVDVMQELRSMKGWLDANPQKRKTKRGILRFVNAWLEKRQNQGGYQKPQEKPKPASGNPFAEYLKQRQNIVGEVQYREVNDNDY